MKKSLLVLHMIILLDQFIHGDGMDTQPQLATDSPDGLFTIANDDDFNKKMEANTAKLVIVDYTATWCGPCRAIAPFFKDLPRKYPEAVFLKVDIDECNNTTTAQEVTAMPTFVLYYEGKAVDRVIGAKKDDLTSKIKREYQQHYGPLEIKQDSDFIPQIKTNPAQLILVNFTAKGYGPCRMIAPIFKELSKKYPEAVFFKVDTDECPETTKSENVNAMPTFILYREGEVVDRVVGAKKDELQSKIDKFYDGKKTKRNRKLCRRQHKFLP